MSTYLNSSGRLSSSVERLYFTGYILSIPGVGDFKHTTSFFEILTSGFSLFVLFFSTAMAYLLSISSGVIHKRSLALSIINLGYSPAKVVKQLLELETSFSYHLIANLQQMINKHSSYYLA